MTGRFDDLIEDETLDAVVVATPVPTHHALARRALLAGKHVFVEKPLAWTVAEARELEALAAERSRIVMVGHLLRFHPAVVKLRELIESGELGDVLYVYGNRQNLGVIREDENALWSLGVHDISVVLYLLGGRPVEVSARGECYLRPGVEDVVFGYLKLASRPGRAPAPVVARPPQDAQDDRGRLQADGRVRRHGGRPQGDRLRQGPGADRAGQDLDAHRRHHDPRRLP